METDADATLAVTAHCEPIRESGDGFHKRWTELREFRPTQDLKVYTGNDFDAFLPEHSVAVGHLASAR